MFFRDFKLQKGYTKLVLPTLIHFVFIIIFAKFLSQNNHEIVPTIQLVT